MNNFKKKHTAKNMFFFAIIFITVSLFGFIYRKTRNFSHSSPNPFEIKSASADIPTGPGGSCWSGWGGACAGCGCGCGCGGCA
jgi:hypothetical protein